MALGLKPFQFFSFGAGVCVEGGGNSGGDEASHQKAMLASFEGWIRETSRNIDISHLPPANIYWSLSVSRPEPEVGHRPLICEHMNPLHVFILSLLFWSWSVQSREHWGPVSFAGSSFLFTWSVRYSRPWTVLPPCSPSENQAQAPFSYTYINK